MKIIVLTPNYPRRGAMMNGHFIHQQIKALTELGVECHVLLTHNWFPPFGLHRLHIYWREGFAKKTTYLSELEGVKIHHVPVFVKMPNRFFKEDQYEREANAIASFIGRTKVLKNAAWIYAHFLTDCGYIGTLVKKKIGVRLAAIARGDDVHAWPEENQHLVYNLRKVFHEADLLFAASNRLAQDAKKWFVPGFDREIKTIYNGVDDSRFRPARGVGEKILLRQKLNLPLDKKLLLSVAAPVALKGWIELLDAIKRIGDDFKDWRLVVVTPPRHYRNVLDIEAESAIRGVLNNLIHSGPIDPEQMPDYYRAMDAFVLASYNEGLSNAVMEAMASGLSVVATDVGGHRELIASEKNGILIPAKNTSLLEEALRRLMSDGEFLEYISANARPGALRLGTFKENALKLLNEFKSFAQNPIS